MEKDTGLIKSIFVGHFIIVLHILLIAAVGLRTFALDEAEMPRS